jgi:hypothetical protein
LQNKITADDPKSMEQVVRKVAKNYIDYCKTHPATADMSVVEYARYVIRHPPIHSMDLTIDFSKMRIK